MNVSIVVPVYNSEGSLDELTARLRQVLASCAEEFEIVFVNDGSRDRSWDVVRELVARHDWVRGIDLMRNYGQHNALLCGIREARHEIIVTMDDDLQNPPEEVPKLLEALGEKVDVVYGTPDKGRHGLLRNLASRLTKRALKGALGAATARRSSAFRAFRTKLRESFAGFEGSYVCIDVLLTWGTTRFSSVRVRHVARKVGKSNYTFVKLLTHAVNMMTGFSVKPLRFASFVGFVFSFFGVVALAYVLIRYFIEGGSVPGFPFLASIIAIFSGAQLFALGIIGEYLARMYFRSMNRPPYAVRAIQNHAGKSDNHLDKARANKAGERPESEEARTLAEGEL